MKILTRFCAILSTFILAFTAVPVSAKNTDNFYFESFDADYYIVRDAEGVSHMHVVENLTAIFPDYDQNKGIVRKIPYTNQDGANVTIDSRSALNVSIKRNGLKEPIYDIEKEDGYYIVSSGDETYVRGRQVYTFEYDFARVITDFDSFQELYWDTNGTDWPQRFENLTARVHFQDADQIIIDEATSCYVGTYGKTGEGRCTITKIKNGFEFSATNLSRRENLTFAIRLKPNSFSVPISYNYTLIVALVILGIFTLFVIYNMKKYFDATRAKKSYYKGLFVAPQYQPMQDVSVAEMGELALITTKDSRVASLMDLAVKHKITLIKGKEKLLGRCTWSVEVNDLTDVPNEQITVLTILNGGEQPTVGTTFEVKNNRPTATLQLLARSYAEKIKVSLADKGLLEEDAIPGGRGNHKKTPVKKYSGRLGTFVVIWGIILCSGLPVLIEVGAEAGGVVLGGAFAVFLIVIMGIFCLVAPITATSSRVKYESRTEKGLAAARYVEGLKLYISMAEAERISFLQSVDNADTSPEGIVKLYEKLLPYAVLFGVETSWLKEMERYYQMDNVNNPTWYSGSSIRASDFHAFVMVSSTSFNRSTMTNSNGSSSSSSHGSGGGGHSGGGGGGGGGGGR